MLGLARLMTRYYQGEDLSSLGQQLLNRANADDPEAMLDLAILLQLRGEYQAGLAMHSLALTYQQHYHLASDNRQRSTRLLALMAPGDLMANMPLEFLCNGAGLALDMLYVVANASFPENLPDHDVLIIAACEMESIQPVLNRIHAALGRLQKPLLNKPECIQRVTRDRLCVGLKGRAGLCVPATIRLDRATLSDIATAKTALPSVLEEAQFPIIIRPVDSHAGHGLSKLASVQALESYLLERDEAQYFICPFIDSRDAQGQFRKYRVVMIDGQPFLAHMAVSEHWMVHYLNAGMTESAHKRDLEARAMAEFNIGFAREHGAALQALYDYTGLDYFSIDCSQTRDGELLIFEAGSSMVVHGMDPVATFPYKQLQMQRIFAAFGKFIEARATGI